MYGDPLNEALILRNEQQEEVGSVFNDGTGNAFKNWNGVVTLSRSEVHSIMDKGWMILAGYDDYDIGYIVNGLEIYSKRFLKERVSLANPTVGFSGGIYARWDSSMERWISTAVNRPIDGFNGYLSVSLLRTGTNRIKLVARFGETVKVIRSYQIFVRE